MNKLKTILAASIAATLILSCSNVEEIFNGDSSSSNVNATNPSSSSSGNNPSSSGNNPSSSSGGNVPSSSSGGGDSPSGGGTTETYTLDDYGIDDDGDYYFRYLEPYEYCSGKSLVSDTWGTYRYYSINNKTMIWGLEGSYKDGDSLQFKGSSDDLMGAWTRKRSSCKQQINDEGRTYMYCKRDYDVTNAVFTNTTVAITREECPTDFEVDGGYPYDGWRLSVVGCNIIEMSKGLDKMTLYVSNAKAGVKWTSSKGGECEWKAPTTAQKQALCQKADENNSLDYIIENEIKGQYYSCLRTILPGEFFGNGGDYCDINPEECSDGGEDCWEPDEDGDSYDWCGYAAKPAIAAKPATSATVTKPATKALKAKAKTAKFTPLLKKK